MRKVGCLLVFIVCLGLASCADRPDGRMLVNVLSMQAGFQPLTLDSGAFMLKGWLRPGTGPLLHVYIENDGLAWYNRSSPSSDPTPVAMTVLSMAAADPSHSPVLYLARPGQYVEGKETRGTSIKYWTSHRFAPEVVHSINSAIKQVQNRLGSTQIALYGHSGGGALATLVAEDRMKQEKDVVFLATAAAVLDTQAWTEYHNVTRLYGSMNPKKEAARLAHLPQLHMGGTKDSVVPFELISPWCQDLAPGPCETLELQGATHETGWVEAWPQLLQKFRDGGPIPTL